MDEHAFGEYLVTDGIISAATLAEATERQAVVTGRLDTVLLDMGVLTESKALAALGRFLKARTVTGVELASVSPEVARIISPRVARRFKVLPFRKDGNRLQVASMAPLDLLVEDELALLTGCMISNFVGLELRISYNLARFYGSALSVPLATVLKRLSGKPKRDAPSRTGATATPAPAPAPKHVAPEKPVLDQMEKELPSPALAPRPAAVSELELGEEDFALFPSLRGDVASVEVDATVPEAEAAVAPAAEPVAPSPPATVRKAAPPATLSPDERLAAAADALQGAEMRDDIADAILDFCEPYYRRRMLLVVRKGAIVGWRAEGEGVDEAAIRAISIPAGEPSVFLGLDQSTSFWLGALPPMPRNVDLVFGLGGDHPRDCVIVPIAVKSKIVCFLYADNTDASVTSAPTGLLRRLISKAGVAFQVYLLKSKIRLL